MVEILKLLEIIDTFCFLLPSLLLIIFQLINFRLNRRLKIKRIKRLSYICILSILVLTMFSIIVTDSSFAYENMQYSEFIHMWIILKSCLKVYLDIFIILSISLTTMLIVSYMINTKNIIEYYEMNKNILYLHFSLSDFINYFNLFIETKIFVKKCNNVILLSETAYNQFCLYENKNMEE